MEQKNKKLFIFLKYLVFFVSFYILFRANINGIIYPFNFGLYFALVWCNQNILVLSPLYILASYISTFSILNLLSATFVCFCMCIIYLIHTKLKKPIKQNIMLIYSLICLSFSVFLKIYSGFNIVLTFVELVFGLLYMFVQIKVLESAIYFNVFKKITILNLVFIFVIIASVSSGLSTFNIYNFSIIKMVVSFLILFMSKTVSSSVATFVSLAFGVGTILNNNNPYLIAPIIFYLLASLIFKNNHKIFACLSVGVVEVLCNYYFNFYYTTNYIVMLPTFVSCLICLLIPKKVYSFCFDAYNSNFVNRSAQTIINRNRKEIHSKLLNLSYAFSQMDKVFKSTIKKGASEQELKQLMFMALQNKMCFSCPEKTKCLKKYADQTNSAFSVLIDRAFLNGKVTLLDIPGDFTSRCFKINTLVQEINNLVLEYKNYANLVSNIDASKVLISEQLCGVSSVMKELSYDVNKNVEFNESMEKEIVSNLIYNDISCCQAIVYYDNQNITKVVLEVKKEDSLKAKIAEVVSKVCKVKMIVETEYSSETKGWQILNLKTAPKFDIIFGTGAITKSSSQKSGDCYSLIRMQDGKILMALCDGMGSGEKAKNASETAISLVENFYRAGFCSETILSIINKFLVVGGDDVFSCLDMSVIDLKNGTADFVKLGATNGYIKHKETTSVVECKSLPLGIVSTITPTIKSCGINSGDMIILCTDGVTDSFATDDEMTDFINNIQSLNPQEVADTILNEALKNCNNTALDDMTILVGKIY